MIGITIVTGMTILGLNIVNNYNPNNKYLRSLFY